MISKILFGALFGAVGSIGYSEHHDDQPGNDTVALMLILDEAKPMVCEIVDEYRGDMTNQQVIDTGTAAFEGTFNPSDEVVYHMQTILSECAFGLTGEMRE